MKNKSSFRLTMLPFTLLVFIGLILYQGLQGHPADVPSPLVGQPAPAFSLPTITSTNPRFTESIFQGHITLFSIWASWCEACQAEHPLLMRIATDNRFNLVGLNYRDNPEAARAWLNANGNPYRLILSDPSGKTGIDWGVYGTPETFVIDKNGIIRYKQTGIITPKVWRDVFEPLLQRLGSEK